jgi:hypothetical protein
MAITRKNQLLVWLRRFKYDLIAVLANVASAHVAFKEQTAVAFAITALVFTISFVVVIYFRTKDKAFYFLPLRRAGQDKDWVGRGKLNFSQSEKAYEITDSHAGFIFPKTTQWDDYSFDFEFKIANVCLGWVVRAVNLSNYIMLQCGYDGINPHIRINGNWSLVGHGEANLTFEENLSPDKWYRAVVTCEKRNIKMTIYDGKTVVFDRHWIIPDNIIINFERPGSQPDLRIAQEVDFDFGAIGFRNHGAEDAFVRNVYVERLQA